MYPLTGTQTYTAIALGLGIFWVLFIVGILYGIPVLVELVHP